MEDCLRNIGYYSKIVIKLELFIKKCSNDQEFSTQVYQAFSQCLIEYLRYYKQNLNTIAIDLARKGLNLFKAHKTLFLSLMSKLIQ